MKKGLFLSLLLAVLFVGMGNVKALALFGTTTNASGTVYSSTNSTLKGGSVSIQNNGANSAAYLGIDADKTIAAGKKYQATISFVNSSFKFTSITATNKAVWSVDSTTNTDGTITVTFTAQKDVAAGQALVALIKLDATSAEDSENCLISISGFKEVDSPKCTVENNKYYDANGNEVTKAEYEAACTNPENPQTGAELPILVLVGGALLAGGIYLMTKKNKMYNI